MLHPLKSQQPDINRVYGAYLVATESSVLLVEVGMPMEVPPNLTHHEQMRTKVHDHSTVQVHCNTMAVAQLQNKTESQLTHRRAQTHLIML